MAHKTLIGGTGYEVSGGKALVSGTGYEVSGGRTLIGGTGYDISFLNVDPVLANNTPEQIQAAAQAGVASSLWSVGDMVPITLNGTVGALTFSNETYYAFILGFDHNSSIEGSNTIHFQFGKTSAGVDIAFVDKRYDKTSNVASTSGGFRMNTAGDTTGGWESSHMRSAICPEFLSAMPTAWQSVIAACTKYSDNAGDRSTSAENVTSTLDTIWLLSEYEVKGTNTYANSAEQNYQQQYSYYANGNSGLKYQHSATATTCAWWGRSQRTTSGSSFCLINQNGVSSSNVANYSHGFAPGFMVA